MIPAESQLIIGSVANELATNKQWIIDPRFSSRLEISLKIILYVPAFAFKKQNGQVVEKPIKLTFGYFKGLESIINNGKNSAHVFGLLDHFFQCRMYASRLNIDLKMAKPAILEIDLPKNIIVPLTAKLAHFNEGAEKTESDKQWGFTRSKKMVVLKKRDKRILSCMLSSTGWWSVATLRMCDFSKQIFNIRPMVSKRPFKNLRAVFIYEGINAFFEIKANYNGFGTLEQPKLGNKKLIFFDKKGINTSNRQRIIEDFSNPLLRVNMR